MVSRTRLCIFAGCVFALAPVVPAFGGFPGNVVDSGKKAVVNGAKTVNNTLGQGKKAYEETIGKVANGANNVGSQVGNGLNNAGSQVGNGLNNVGSQAGNVANHDVSQIGDAFNKTADNTGREAARTVVHTVNAGQAVGRYLANEFSSARVVLSDADRRFREGKVVDAIWGLSAEWVQSDSKNAGEAMRESSVLRSAAQLAAGAYGGPGGAAAFASWYTYTQTHDANLAIRAGIITGAASTGLQSVANMPSDSATELTQKAIVGGAIGGLAVAASGGTKEAIKTAFLEGGGMIVVQDFYTDVTMHPLDANSLQAPTSPGYCMLTEGAACSPPDESYFLDDHGQVMHDADGNPMVDVRLTDSASNHVGIWAKEGDTSLPTETGAFMNAIAKIPGANAMALFHDQWAVSWNMGPVMTPVTIAPAVVLTYIGTGSPIYDSILEASTSAPSAPPAHPEAGSKSK